MEMCSPKALGGKKPVCFCMRVYIHFNSYRKESIKYSCNLEHAILETCWLAPWVFSLRLESQRLQGPGPTLASGGREGLKS